MPVQPQHQQLTVVLQKPPASESLLECTVCKRADDAAVSKKSVTTEQLPHAVCRVTFMNCWLDTFPLRFMVALYVFSVLAARGRGEQQSATRCTPNCCRLVMGSAALNCNACIRSLCTELLKSLD
eukprot:12765-Heterococcus_DN1.PRE.4